MGAASPSTRTSLSFLLLLPSLYRRYTTSMCELYTMCELIEKKLTANRRNKGPKIRKTKSRCDAHIQGTKVISTSYLSTNLVGKSQKDGQYMGAVVSALSSVKASPRERARWARRYSLSQVTERRGKKGNRNFVRSLTSPCFRVPAPVWICWPNTC